MNKLLIILLWVIHLSGLIGIGLGYNDFFFTKSPFTLLYLLVVLILLYAINTVTKAVLLISISVIGIVIEWIGVHTGMLFGSYYYGDNLGPKIDGIPYLIGINWAVLSFVSNSIARHIINKPSLQIVIGSLLMVILDVFLEQICDYAGFWYFIDGAGWFNYLCWFVLAMGLNSVLNLYNIRGNFWVSLHIYIVQLIFALSLWIITMI